MTTHYRSSNGRVTPVADMHDAHLANAISKLAKSGKDAVMLHALKAEASKRVGRAPVERTVSAASAYKQVFGR